MFAGKAFQTHVYHWLVASCQQLFLSSGYCAPNNSLVANIWTVIDISLLGYLES